MSINNTSYIIYLSSRLLLVKLGQILNILLATKEHRAPLVDARRLDVQNTSSTSDRDSSRLLREHRHRERLVQDTELAALALFVIWVSEDSTVQEGTMYVRNHGPKTQGSVQAPRVEPELKTHPM